MSLRPTERFSERVGDYTRHRPSYPEACVQYLCERASWRPGDHIADVGSGTGFFSKLLLDKGLRVTGIEPNPEMRAAGEHLLRDMKGFESLPTTAEATQLPDHSVVGISVAQAFHWFDLEEVRTEFQRVLRKQGFVALIWNARRTSTPFLEAYEAHLRTHGIRYAEINHAGLPDAVFQRFYGHADFGPKIFDNAQVLDFEGLQGRHFSSSYVPSKGHPGYAPALEDLRRIFSEHEREGHVTIEYDTKVFCAQLA